MLDPGREARMAARMNKLSLFADLLAADRGVLEDILGLAREIKAKPADYASVMKGKLLYGLYQKTSTRTHLSFARALADLGGSYVWQTWDSSNFTIGDFEHEARYVSATADVVMARLVSNDDVKRLCSNTTSPVINGCCNKYHPMQGLADALTMIELVGSWRDIRCVYVGVLNNVANSLMTCLPRLGAELVAVCPEINEAALDPELLREAEGSKKFTLVKDPSVARLRQEIERANVVYTDTWVDMEDFSDESKAAVVAERVERLRAFQLNAANYGKSEAYVLHCMPVHPGYEIDRALLSHPRARILEQADNRTHAQKAALTYLFR